MHIVLTEVRINANFTKALTSANELSTVLLTHQPHFSLRMFVENLTRDFWLCLLEHQLSICLKYRISRWDKTCVNNHEYWIYCLCLCDWSKSVSPNMFQPCCTVWVSNQYHFDQSAPKNQTQFYYWLVSHQLASSDERLANELSRSETAVPSWHSPYANHILLIYFDLLIKFNFQVISE